MKAAIRDRALALGFDAVGFARAALRPAIKADLAQFLAQGFHGDMGWLERRAEARGDPKTLWPEAGTVVALGLNYGPADPPLAGIGALERGNFSVYARNRDYHDLLKIRLRALAQWIHGAFGCELKLFVDTAPVMEKPLAQAAGLGWQGKHTNLVSREWGSWLFLGEIYLALELPEDEADTDHCGSCRACLDSCPTGAFPAPYRLDARRCISYLTIEHKGHIPAGLRPLMGNRIFGCDDCLAACPWNKFARATAEPGFLPREDLTAPLLASLVALDEPGFRTHFKGSPVKRIGHARFLRNLLIAIGNSGEENLLPRVQARLDDASELVRAMAVWALNRLAPAALFTDERTRRLARETDDQVQEEWGRA
ncbi:MAG TPA: tRNA epoxyqueuosine(34) reductase QueG [Stellaceae bacterium]|nr:tRNA epoxyqueuosine(34) reductase QueG [Stellaceae bacterium]